MTKKKSTSKIIAKKKSASKRNKTPADIKDKLVFKPIHHDSARPLGASGDGGGVQNSTVSTQQEATLAHGVTNQSDFTAANPFSAYTRGYETAKKTYDIHWAYWVLVGAMGFLLGRVV